eukprot:GHUV01004894.1.p1 GENE.GHUV01004894.1~~GHUV01004894.1.p1  ORF type:complete len:314 (+),score=67.32 GHUV01004894.1:89-1030(+)
MLGLVSSRLLCQSFSFKATSPYFQTIRNAFRTHIHSYPPLLPQQIAPQQARMQSAVCSIGQTASSRPIIQRQRNLQALKLSAFPQTRCFSAQLISSTVAVWQLKAEAGIGGGSTGGGAGGKKGYSSGGESSSSGGDGFLAAYNRMLEQNPLLIKAITAAVLSAVGNLICQVLVEKKEEVDLRRLSIFTGLGFVWVAPCLHLWYGRLATLVTATGNTGAILRMACDQLGFAPLFVGSMIAILTALDGKADQIVPELKSSLPSAIKANWMLWVPAQFINFRFVPVNYQVLFSNLVAVAWNVYFSFATRPKEAVAA